MPASFPGLRCQVACVVLGAAAVTALSAPLLAQGVQPLTGVQPPPRAQPQPAPATGVAGLWIDHTGDGAVEIAPCTASAPDRLCGRIVWLKIPNDESGRPLRDGLNEDQSQRRRPICGLPVLGDIRRQPGGTYEEGWIYDPRRGQAFSVEVTLKDPNRLQVMGYKGVKFLSKTFMWTRATGELPRCATTAAKT